MNSNLLENYKGVIKVNDKIDKDDERFFYKELPISEAAVNEINALVQCASNHVVTLQEVIQTSTICYTLVFLNEGTPLSLYLCNGLPLHKASTYFLNIVSAISHLHNEIGFCHRDIKPANIILKDKNEAVIKMCDFGYACPNTSQLSGAVGSPGFFAPEMFLSNSYDGNLADIWSLGCTFLEIIIGETKFEKHWLQIGPFTNISNIEKSRFQLLMLRALKSLKDLGRRGAFSDDISSIFRLCICMQPDRRVCSKELKQMILDFKTTEETIQSNGERKGT
jgi:serine/threonine protein kinase